MTISELNRNGSAAVSLARERGQVSITDHGRCVAFILSAERVDGLLETLDVMSNPEAMNLLREHKAGKLAMRDLEEGD